MIRFSAPIRIGAPSNVFLLISAPIIILKYGYVSAEVHLPLIAHKRMVMPHYKNSGLRLTFSTIMSMWVHQFFKRMISSSNFVAIARLVVLARKDPGTTSPFSSLLDLYVVLFNKYSSFNFTVDRWTFGCFSEKEISTLSRTSSLPWGNKSK